MDEGEDNNIVLVTVATFPEAIEAHIYRNRLEAEGIPSVIADENIISNQPWHSIAYGGVKLRVRAQDQEKALALINEIRHGLITQPGQDEADMDENYEAPTCPVCNSQRLRQKQISGIWSLIKSVLFLYPMRTRIKLTCLNCGYRWQLEK
jgi:predicted nucleic-acid-binding Zn-ribbon protein